MGTPNLPRGVKFAAFFVAILLALLAIVGVGIGYAYQGKYYPGVEVGPVSVGGLSKEAAIAKVTAWKQSVTTKKVTVAIPDITQGRNELTGFYPTQEVASTADSLGLAVATDQALSDGWQLGHTTNPLQWLRQTTRLFFGSKDTFPVTPTVSDTKVGGFVTTQVVTKAAAAQPAKLVIDGKNVTIQDEVPGLTVDNASLTNELTTALTASRDGDPLSLRISPILADAKIGRTTVQPLADQLTTLGDMKVTLSAPDVSLTPARSQLLLWYTPVQSDSGTLSLSVNSDAISAYLQKYGKTLDQTKSLASLRTAATAWLGTTTTSAQVAVVAKPAATVTAGDYQAGLFDGKYVYVNLADQKLYRLNGSTVEKVYRVSTGKWSTPTPRGTFTIASKSPRAYSATFGLYMPWWENFLGTSAAGEDLPTGSYGLHELPEWPNGYKEGEGHIGTPVSHGCVRLGVGDAEEIYNWTEIGTPVVIQ